jgi:hypothetical protein
MLNFLSPMVNSYHVSLGKTMVLFIEVDREQALP